MNGIFRILIFAHNSMKQMKCDLCDHVAEGETFEEWMNNLKPHYMEMHADVIKNPQNGKEEMMKWVGENRKRFEELH